MLYIGCVENIPLTVDDGEVKYFVVCEMTPGQNIEASVSLTGSTVSTLPKHLPMPEELVLSITEGNKDFAVNFMYDTELKKFVISNQRLNLKIGETYKIREESGAFFAMNQDIKLQIPSAINIDSITILSKNITLLPEGNQLTSLKCKIKLNRSVNLKSYLLIRPETDNGSPWEINKISGPVGAYTIQYHQSGCLIDYENIGQEFILDISLISNKTQEDVKFTIFNTTRAYYYYNTFMSNNYGQIDQSLSSNPAIASEGLNIRTNEAIGTFSALVPTSILVSIK